MLLGMVGAQAAATPAEDLAAYDGELAAAELILAAAADGSPAEQQAAAAQAAKRIRAMGAYRFPTPAGSSLRTPDHSDWLRALVLEPPAIATVLAEVRTLRTAIAQARYPRAAWSGDETARLQQILARPQFQAREGRGLLTRILDELALFIERALLRLLYELDRFTSGRASPGNVGALAIGLLLLAGLTAFVVRGLRASVAASAQVPLETAAGPRAAAAWEQARALAAAGDHRGALRQSYLALLLELDERGRLPFHPSLTNREYLHRAERMDPALAAALRPLVESFDRLWYGQRHCSAEEYERFVAQVAAVRGGLA